MKDSREISITTPELEAASLPPDVSIKTASGRKLVALRARYIADGGKLYSQDEISKQLGRTRD